MSRMRLYHADSKRELLALVVRSAPGGEVAFRIAQPIPPGGWIVEFGTGTEANGFFSIHAVGVALGLEKIREVQEKPVKDMSRAITQAYENNPRYILRGVGAMRLYR